jgi:NADH-quinone oxidoreductase subunit J
MGPTQQIATTQDALLYGLVFLLTTLGAVGVLVNRDTVKAALSLVLVMVMLAVNFLLMGQEFVAFIQIIVYAGAIMVVFLFVIMLLNLREREQSPWYLRNARLLGGFLAAAFFLVTGFAVRTFFGTNEATAASLGMAEPLAIASLSTALITKWVGPFVLTSVLLLVAVIGAVVMARRQDEDGNDIVVEAE